MRRQLRPSKIFSAAVLIMLTGYSNLAQSYLLQWVWQWNHDTHTLEQAREIAEQAVALSDSLFWLHSTLGGVYLWQKRYTEALLEMERAVALKPGDPMSVASLGGVLNHMGRPQETLEKLEQAKEIEKVNPNFSLAVWTQRVPYQDPAVIEQLAAALHKAGLE